MDDTNQTRLRTIWINLPYPSPACYLFPRETYWSLRWDGSLLGVGCRVQLENMCLACSDSWLPNSFNEVVKQVLHAFTSVFALLSNIAWIMHNSSLCVCVCAYTHLSPLFGFYALCIENAHCKKKEDEESEREIKEKTCERNEKRRGENLNKTVRFQTGHQWEAFSRGAVDNKPRQREQKRQQRFPKWRSNTLKETSAKWKGGKMKTEQNLKMWEQESSGRESKSSYSHGSDLENVSLSSRFLKNKEKENKHPCDAAKTENLSIATC